jgi:hypothetical protein
MYWHIISHKYFENISLDWCMQFIQILIYEVSHSLWADRRIFFVFEVRDLSRSPTFPFFLEGFLALRDTLATAHAVQLTESNFSHFGSW